MTGLLLYHLFCTFSKISMAAKGSDLLRTSNILAFVLMIIVNGLAGSTTLLGGRTTAAVSDANPTLITPAGYVFAIWGVIYVLLGAFVIYQSLPNERMRHFQQRIGWLFVLSSALNISWIISWQYNYLIASVIIIFLLLATLIQIYVRLNSGRAKIRTGEKLAVHLPFSIYLGWITIASIADVSVTLVSLNWNGLGISPETWAVLIIMIALVIAILVAATRRDVAYELVIIWAFVGIAANQSSNQLMVALLLACIVVIIIALAMSIRHSRSKLVSQRTW